MNRNYGIDFLRIMAMFFVLVLHALNFGGLLSNTIVGSVQYKAVWLLEIFCYCAVDVFALISGYVSWTKKPNYRKFIMMWFQVLFCDMFLLFVFCIYKPESLRWIDSIRVFFPIVLRTHWYFTAYAGLMILKPFIDPAIRELDNDKLKKLFVIIFILFSVLDNVFKKFSLDVGYSVIWLVLLYILGAIINKCEIGKNIKSRYLCLAVLLFVIITYLCKIYGPTNIEFIYDTFGVIINKDLFVSYVSPTILGIAICFIILGSRIVFNRRLISIIKYLSSSAFAVYLLNQSFVIKDIFVSIIYNSVSRIYIKVLLFCLLFFIVCIIIDKIRIKLFKIYKIDILVDKIYLFLYKMINCVTRYI